MQSRRNAPKADGLQSGRAHSGYHMRSSIASQPNRHKAHSTGRRRAAEAALGCLFVCICLGFREYLWSPRGARRACARRACKAAAAVAQRRRARRAFVPGRASPSCTPHASVSQSAPLFVVRSTVGRKPARCHTVAAPWQPAGRGTWCLWWVGAQPARRPAEEPAGGSDDRMLQALSVCPAAKNSAREHSRNATYTSGGRLGGSGDRKFRPVPLDLRCATKHCFPMA